MGSISKISIFKHFPGRDTLFKSLLLRSKISEKPKENQGFLAFFGLEKCNSSDGVALFRRSTSY